MATFADMLARTLLKAETATFSELWEEGLVNVLDEDIQMWWASYKALNPSIEEELKSHIAKAPVTITGE